MPNQEVYAYANAFIADLIASGEEWPEDDWHEIAPGWDLNLSSSGGKRYASLYPVVDGSTDTSKHFPIKLS